MTCDQTYCIACWARDDRPALYSNSEIEKRISLTLAPFLLEPYTAATGSPNKRIPVGFSWSVVILRHRID